MQAEADAEKAQAIATVTAAEEHCKEDLQRSIAEIQECKNEKEPLQKAVEEVEKKMIAPKKTLEDAKKAEA